MEKLVKNYLRLPANLTSGRKTLKHAQGLLSDTGYGGYPATTEHIEEMNDMFIEVPTILLRRPQKNDDTDKTQQIVSILQHSAPTPNGPARRCWPARMKFLLNN
jgi:hypothetical protein